MNRLFVVLQYEIMNYIKNKSFVISTVLISCMACIILFLPRFIDMSSILGIDREEEKSDDIYLVYDECGLFDDTDILENIFALDVLEMEKSRDNIEERLKENDTKVVGGFVVTSNTDYEYIVYDSEMGDDSCVKFNEAMKIANLNKYCKDNNVNMAEIMGAYNPEINTTQTILGKSIEDNYWYCYILVIAIFMIIILYGVMVATSVTQEKSNRTIEMLVTSADTNCLFFGKVIAGTLSALLQVGVIIIAVIGSYRINSSYWGGKLDFLLNIPNEVLITFAFFGLGGLLFYTFIYGAMGALVSKTEDINKSAGSVQMIIMIVYFVVLLQMSNVNGPIMKVFSFLPFSSYSAMFIRISMGQVEMWEVITSFAILVASIIGVGVVGSKIYRMGTLRYGNPIKLTNAIKSLKRQ